MLFFIINIIIILTIFYLLKYVLQQRRVASTIDLKSKRISLPIHHAYCFFLWSLSLSIFINIIQINQYIKLFIIIPLLLLFALFFNMFYRRFNAQKHIEKWFKTSLLVSASLGVAITVAITIIIFFEAYNFFKIIPLHQFLFSIKWSPQMAMNSNQEVVKASFGILPVLCGTFLITIISMIIAIPIGIMGAINLALYSSQNIRNILKPAIEVLAGIPTVVYGYFAAIFIAPLFRDFFSSFGINIESESAIAAGFVMGVMITPLILSLSDDAISSVPQSLKDGALAMGSTKSEMILKVVLPAAMPNIIGSFILAFSRAIGETMIVVMASGLIAKLTLNPFASVTTTTAQIVSLLAGDQEFDNPKTLAAFALVMALFVITFILNVIALMIIKNYKKKFSF